MSPVETAIVYRKLAAMQEALDLLEPIARFTYEQYMQQVYYRKAAERLLQTVVESAVDLNNHLLVGHHHPPASDYHQSFLDLAGKTSILSAELAQQLAPSTGLRNRLVHEYDELDHRLVLSAVGEARRLYPLYIAAIQKALTHRQES